MVHDHSNLGISMIISQFVVVHAINNTSVIFRRFRFRAIAAKAYTTVVSLFGAAVDKSYLENMYFSV